MQTQQDRHSVINFPTYTTKRIPFLSINSNTVVEASQNPSQFETSFGTCTQQIATSCKYLQNKQNGNLQYSTKNTFDKQVSKNHSSTFLQSSTKNSLNNIEKVDFSFLAPLKSQFNTQYLQDQLKKKTFDFNLKFYQSALSLIQKLGYKGQPDYSYLTSQAELCEQIHRLTEQYSAAVQQDIEQIVKQNLSISKKLCDMLNAKKVGSIIKKYIKMGGQSLQYKVAKLAYIGQVDKVFLQRVMKQENFAQIAIGMYLSNYFGEVQRVTNFVEKFVEYVRINYGPLITAGQVVTYNIPLLQQYYIPLVNILSIGRYQIDQSSQFYLINILKIINKKCKSSTISQSLETEIVPSIYITYFSQLATKQQINSYTLACQMAQFIHQHHICSLCLKEIQHTSQASTKTKNNNSDRYAHIKCLQLVQVISNFSLRP